MHLAAAKSAAAGDARVARRRNPSGMINERRRQRISGALVNLPVEDKRVSAFDSFVVGETTRKRPTSPGRSERDTVAFQG